MTRQEQFDYLLGFYSNEQLTGYCTTDDKLFELWQYSQPQEMNIEDLQDANNGTRYLADSPDGWVPVEQWRNKGIKQLFKMIMDDDSSITASHDHLFQKIDYEWSYMRDLCIGDALITDAGSAKIKLLIETGNDTVYDLAIGHDNHRYFTNGICSHNSGKSLFLQNIALNWSFMGYDVVYISLELSENLVAARFDSMVTGMNTKDIFRKIDDVDLRVRMAGKKAGKITVKKMPEAGTNCNTLRAYLKEYEIKYGKLPEALVVDYLDLMYPNNGKINPSDMFIKDKFVAEELRALYSEFNLLGCSASQLNRGSIEANGVFDHSHIAGGISKINTADNVFGIFTTPAMKERGEYQLQMLKTRSSNSVGMMIELGFNNQSLRISDPMPDQDELEKQNSASLQNSMKTRLQQNKQPNAVETITETVDSEDDTPPPRANPVKADMMAILNRVQRKG